jgi:thioredoxin 1
MMGQRPTYAIRIFAVVWAACALAAAVMEYFPAHSEVQWVPYELAFTKARAENKLVYVDVYAEWCGPCKLMDRTTFVNDTIIAMLRENYIATRVNVDDETVGAKVKDQFDIKAMPTALMLRSEKIELKRTVGYMNAATLMEWLADTSLSEFLVWDSFSSAVTKAGASKKNLLLLVLHDSLKVMEMQRAFLNKNVKQMIKKQFIPVLLINSNPSDRKPIEQYALLPSFDFVGCIYTFTPSMELIRTVPLRNWDSNRIQTLMEELTKPPVP